MAHNPFIQKIVSGGQTGADRGGHDWAIWHEIAHGGWCPKGRRAEDGVIPAVYRLDPTPIVHYRQRTGLNQNQHHHPATRSPHMKSTRPWLRKGDHLNPPR